MQLSNSDIVELVDFRHALHRRPELSGEEAETAQAVVSFLTSAKPDRIITGLGGHGVAAVYEGEKPGPTVMFRSELDALPIFEIGTMPHKSEVPGKGHLCGHDGHSTILSGLARLIGRRRPKHGRVVLLFQPAEENGAGAAAVLADPQFREIRPDWSFSLHNIPGLPLFHVAVAPGPVNCASRGLRIVLSGRTAHASAPETGVSPAIALSHIIPGLMALAPGGPLTDEFKLATVVHAKLGEPAFGVAPGDAEIWVTLRAMTDDGMASLLCAAEDLARRKATDGRLDVSFSHHDIFAACANDVEATEYLRVALDAEGLTHDNAMLPFRGSEDFGLFGSVSKSAMFFIGAGEAHPMVHNPDYDFPDSLIEPSVRVFHRVLRNLLG